MTSGKRYIKSSSFFRSYGIYVNEFVRGPWRILYGTKIIISLRAARVSAGAFLYLLILLYTFRYHAGMSSTHAHCDSLDSQVPNIKCLLTGIAPLKSRSPLGMDEVCQGTPDDILAATNYYYTPCNQSLPRP